VVVHSGEVLAKGGLGEVVDQFQGADLDALVLTDAADNQSVRHLNAVGDGAPTLPPAGVFACNGRLMRAAAQTPVSWHGERRLTDAIERLVGVDGGRALSRPVSGWWRFGGEITDLIEGNRLALEGLRPAHAGAAIERTEIQGAVVIDRTASVDLAVVRGPVVIGPRAVIRDAYIGPYTSIGPDVTIESAEIEHSIVLAGAEIKHVGRRLETSIVGRGAKVQRDFALPKALRLRVGDSAEVSLS
jgi:glucose-1-phosphate thymidylyltransferase